MDPGAPPSCSGTSSPATNSTGDSQRKGTSCSQEALSNGSLEKVVATAAAAASLVGDRDSGDDGDRSPFCSSQESMESGKTLLELKNPKKKKKNRCEKCNVRVGLTGFTCRCFGLYCSAHRYAEMHECPVDYKTMEREELRKKNPVVVAAKIERI